MSSDLLEQKDTPKEAGGIFKMKTFYESCMSTSKYRGIPLPYI